MALSFKTRKRLVAKEKAGRGCGGRFFQLFCRSRCHPFAGILQIFGLSINQ
jgi:hypothetical protein